MAYLSLISRSRRSAWAFAGVLALACTSNQVPIGEQLGSGGAGGAPAGAGGGGPTGSGGVINMGAGGSPGTGGASRGTGGSVSPGTGGSGAGGASGADASTGIDAGSCSGNFTGALTKDCSTAADCVLANHNDCCGTVVTAIRAGTEPSFATAEQAYQSCVPGCGLRGCFHADMAEDGQTVAAGTGQAFAAQCQSGRCTSVVTSVPVTGATCHGGLACTGNQSCGFDCMGNIGNVTGLAGAGITCSCVNGSYTCRVVYESTAGFTPPACPAAPQGASCAPRCDICGASATSGTQQCFCSADLKWVCN